MDTTKQTSKEYFRTLTLIHIALVSGLIICGIIALVLISSVMSKNTTINLSSVFLFIIPLLIFGGITLSIILYKSRLEDLIISRNLQEKMSKYRGILILKYALVEGPALFAILIAIIAHNSIFLFFAVLNILLMIYWVPTKSSIKRDLKLNQKEIETVDNPDSIIAEIEITGE